MLIGTFLLALLLAWPTFGLSLAVWLAFAWMSAKGAGYAKNSLDDQIEYFKKRYFPGESQAVFMQILAGEQESYGLTVLNGEEMMTLGNIIIRYIVTHPDMTMKFEDIVSRYQRLTAFGTPQPACGQAVRAINLERDVTGIGGALHHLCFQVIQTLRINNPSHRIMRKLDQEDLETAIEVLEMSMDHEREMGRSLL